MMETVSLFVLPRVSPDNGGEAICMPVTGAAAAAQAEQGRQNI